MKLPWQKEINKASQDAPAASSAETSTAQEAPSYPKGYTPPKGRPTPTRQEREIAKGVIRDPNGVNDLQRREHRKDLKNSMSKEEWKEYKRNERAERRANSQEAQRRMAEGDERYLLPRDKGQVRHYVRDWVDSRRFLTEWLMPFALVLLLFTFLGSANPRLANYISIGTLVVIIVFAAEGFWLARQCNNAVRIKFPGTAEAGWGLGFYAYSRASQPRKWRTPKPQVARGATV